MKIIISAKATDSESGIASFKYEITPTTGLSKSTDDLPQDGTPVTITLTAEATYTVKFTATDNAGKIATKEITGVTTVDGGVIKHIKLDDGTLKEVNTKNIYGAEVTGYTCGRSDVQWQIFYIDEEDDHRVYLIAKDYMAPPTTGTEMTKGINSHTYYWNDTVLNKYKTNLPATTATEPLGKFMNDYLSDFAGTSASGQANLQATNYMLDQTMWAEYKGAKADLAFGGPTLPLFKASYNDICKTATKLDIRKSGTGYQVKKGTGNFVSSQDGYGDTSTQKGIYFKGTAGNPAYGMWLASPASYFVCMIFADYEGTVGTFSYIDDEYSYDGCGFRPIISLKSDVQFTPNADGTVYTIN